MNSEAPTFWKKCSNCKNPIGFGKVYQVCSVSTCTRERTGLQFCSVSCWSAHVPLLRHRDAWAIEKIAPTQQAYQSEQVSQQAPAPQRTLVRPGSVPSSSGVEATSGDLPDDVLVVVSKLKAYVKAKADMNTSADVIDRLSDQMRILCDRAIESAKRDGRKTVMARDFLAI